MWWAAAIPVESYLMTAPMPFVSYERARVLDDVNFELLRHGDPPHPVSLVQSG